VDETFAAKLEQVIVSDRFYADPDISLESLAAKMNLPPKKVTLLIKDKYQLNFYEFVNGYRINEAKRLLADTGKVQKTIMDIYLEVGFNSKSVFNTYFKRSVGVTPSRYREQFLSSTAPPGT
jgi:AraC-like DNA-binding protein